MEFLSTVIVVNFLPILIFKPPQSQLQFIMVYYGSERIAKRIAKD